MFSRRVYICTHVQVHNSKKNSWHCARLTNSPKTREKQRLNSNYGQGWSVWKQLSGLSAHVNANFAQITSREITRDGNRYIRKVWMQKQLGVLSIMLIAERKTRYTLWEHFLRPGRKIFSEFQEARENPSAPAHKQPARITPLRAIKFIFGTCITYWTPVGAEISCLHHTSHAKCLRRKSWPRWCFMEGRENQQ